jgi:hypothetical protein
VCECGVRVFECRGVPGEGEEGEREGGDDTYCMLQDIAPRTTQHG